MSEKVSFPIRDLSSEEVEDLLFQSEETARNYISSRIPKKELKNFDILIEYDSEGSEIECVVDLELTKSSKLDPQIVTEEAIQKIFLLIEQELIKKQNNK